MPDGLTNAGDQLVREWLTRDLGEAAEAVYDTSSWIGSFLAEEDRIEQHNVASRGSVNDPWQGPGTSGYVPSVPRSMDRSQYVSLRDMSSDIQRSDRLRRTPEQEERDVPDFEADAAPRVRHRPGRDYRTAEEWPPLKAIICGGRDYGDWYQLSRELSRVKPTDICVGSDRGADGLAIQWAQDKRASYRVMFADWTRYGRAAGPIRNERMLTEHKPDIVIAFPGGAGTRNMVALARRAGVRTYVVDDMGTVTDSGPT